MLTVIGGAAMKMAIMMATPRGHLGNLIGHDNWDDGDDDGHGDDGHSGDDGGGDDDGGFGDGDGVGRDDVQGALTFLVMAMVLVMMRPRGP